jgi:hypothetical protein
VPRLAVIAGVLALSLSGCGAPGTTAERAALDSERGRLLYENACIQCHTTQAHWRDKRIVKDWDGLLAQVTRWQAIAGQSWREAEIRDTAAHLNRTFYRLPCSVPGCAGPAG